MLASCQQVARASGMYAHDTATNYQKCNNGSPRTPASSWGGKLKSRGPGFKPEAPNHIHCTCACTVNACQILCRHTCSMRLKRNFKRLPDTTILMFLELQGSMYDSHALAAHVAFEAANITIEQKERAWLGHACYASSRIGLKQNSWTVL